MASVNADIILKLEKLGEVSNAWLQQRRKWYSLIGEQTLTWYKERVATQTSFPSTIGCWVHGACDKGEALSRA